MMTDSNHQKTRADAFRRARAAHTRAREAVGDMLRAIYNGDEAEAAGVAFEAIRLVAEAANLAQGLRPLAAVPSRQGLSSKSDVSADDRYAACLRDGVDYA